MEELIPVKGLSQLQRFLDELPVKLEKNVMRGALRAGMNVIKPIAASNVHSISGELAAGLKIGTRARAGRIVANLKATGKHAYVAIWVEFGTSAHLIKVQEAEKPINLRLSQRRGVLTRASMSTINRVVLKIGNKFVGPTVSHPGARARKFMRNAIDSQAEAAVVAVAQYIKKRLATKEGLDTSHIMIEGDE